MIRPVIFLLALSPLFAGLMPPTPVLHQLLQQADVVAVGTLESIDDSRGSEFVRVQLTQVLWGQPGSLVVSALVPTAPSFGGLGDMPLTTGLVPRSVIGKSGLWFLKVSDTGWQILPTDVMAGRQLYVSLPIDPSLPQPAGNIDRQILTYLVRWYQTLPAPTHLMDDGRVLADMAYLEADTEMAAANSLIASSRSDQHTFGLIAALRLGSVDALSMVAKETPSLAANPKLWQLTQMIASQMLPLPASIPVLQQIIAMRGHVPGLDAAAGSALQQIGTKAALPALALLLDSDDPQAQLRASWVFNYIARVMEAHGDLSRLEGSFNYLELRQNIPTLTTPESIGAYAQQWKAWWADHRAALGFQPN